MSVPKPTSWPTVWPPDGGYETVAAIADYINEAIDDARAVHNEARARRGNPPLSSEYEWDGVGLPKFPQDGWLRRVDLPAPYHIIGPHGIGGFGLHEFQGAYEVKGRINEMQALTSGTAPPAPSPPPVTEPPPPVTEEPPMPTPPSDVSQPCPEGQYRNLFSGKCEPIPGYNAPAPSPVTPHILILHGRHKIEGFFEPPGSTALKLMPVALNEDNCLMWALSPNNYECWVKVVKSDAGYAVGVTALTNVKYEVSVTDQQTGKQQTFVNDQGNLIGDFRWNALPA